MRVAISAVIIKDKKLLLVKKRKTWILPGGKPEESETDLECLRREIDEELSGTKLSNIKYYNSFKGRTPHKGDILRAKAYFADIDGQLHLSSKEITDSQWVDDFLKYNLSNITMKIVNSLKKDKYLNKA